MCLLFLYASTVVKFSGSSNVNTPVALHHDSTTFNML